MKISSRVVSVVLVGLIAVSFAGCRRQKPAKPVAPPVTPTTPTQVVTPPVQPAVQAPVLTEDDMPLPIRKDVSVPPSKVLPDGFSESPSIEFFGNFHTAGVILQMPASIPVNQVGPVYLFLNVNGQWAPVHNMVRSGSTSNWLGSIFWLQPDSTYQVRVEIRSAANPAVVLATGCRSGQTRKEPVIPETLKNVFVAPNGNDNNPGTLEQPFGTIRKAMTVATAGTTIFIRGGLYYEGDLEFANKGTTEEPIVIRSYKGEKVVMDGSNPDLQDTAKWTSEGNGIYSVPLQGTCWNASIENRKTGKVTRLFPMRTVAEIRNHAGVIPYKNEDGSTPDGSFKALAITAAFATDGSSLVAYLPGPIEDYIPRVAKCTRGFQLENRRCITFEGLQLQFYGKEDYSTAAILYSSSDILFQNCTFLYCDTFIWVKKNSDRVTIQDCVFKDDVKDWPWSFMKCGGAATTYEAGAVNVDSKFSGRGLVFRRNLVQGLFDGAHLPPWTEDDAASNEIDFYQNRILDVMDDFMEVDGFARNVRIFENYMRRSLSGVSMAQALDGPTFVIYNVIADCGVITATSREGLWSYPFKTNGGEGAEDIGSGPMFLYHNTSYTTDPESHAMLIKRPIWKLMALKNNIWVGQKLGFETWRRQPSTMIWDYDDLYVVNPAGPLMLIEYKTGLKTLQEVVTRYGYMKNGISADPMVMDPVAGNYELKNDSPCIDKGVIIPGINGMRKMGTAPDMGAYEMR